MFSLAGRPRFDVWTFQSTDRLPGSVAVADAVIEWASIVVLIMLSALFSGLTLGVMGLDKIGLDVRNCFVDSGRRLPYNSGPP